MIVIEIKLNCKKKLKRNKLYCLLLINKNYLVMKFKKNKEKKTIYFAFSHTTLKIFRQLTRHCKV